MTDSNYTKIFTGNQIITERINQDLKNLDINAIIRGQNESGLDPNIYGGPMLKDIFVHKDELEKAIIVVESVTSSLEE